MYRQDLAPYHGDDSQSREQDATYRTSQRQPVHSLPSFQLPFSGLPTLYQRRDKSVAYPQDASQDFHSVTSCTSSGTDLRSRATLSPVNGMSKARARVDSPLTSPRVSLAGDFTPLPRSGQPNQDHLHHLLTQQERLAQLRSEIITLRVELHDHRDLYRSQRSRARDVDAQYLRAVRAYERDPGNANALALRQQALQELEIHRDNLGPLEERYDDLETRLDRMDFDFSWREQNFMDQLKDYLLGIKTPTTRESFYELPPRNVLPDIPPLLMEYYSKVGDITVLEDRIRNLSQNFETNTNYTDLKYTKRGKSSMKHHVGDLNRFHQEWENLKDQLHAARVDAETLLQRCYRYALEPDPEAIAQTKTDILEATEALCYGRYPILFQLPYGNSKTPNQLLSGFGNTRDRINRWLMDSLRISDLEARRHRQYLPQDLAQLEDHDWASLVWKFWLKDEYGRSSRLSATTSSGADAIRSGVDYSGFARLLEQSPASGKARSKNYSNHESSEGVRANSW